MSWRELFEDPPEHAHILQFYGDPSHQVEAASLFITGGLYRNEKIVLVDSKDRIEQIKKQLEHGNRKLQSHIDSGQFLIMNVEKTLEDFLKKGEVDKNWMKNLASTAKKDIANGKYDRVRYSLRLAPLIAERGRPKLAAMIETLWNNIMIDHSNAMLCAYSMKTMGPSSNSIEYWRDIMRSHHFILSDVGLILPLKPEEAGTVPPLQY